MAMRGRLPFKGKNMGSSVFGALAGMGLLALLVFVVGGLLVGALLLCLAFRMVVGHMPSYLRAIGAVLVTTFVSLLASFLLRMVMPFGVSGLVTLATQFLIGAAVINYFLPAKEGGQIGYGKACMVQLVYLVMAIAIGVVFAVIFGVMFASMFTHMH